MLIGVITYGLRMLLRSGTASSAIFSIAFLVAILTSMSAVASYIVLETQALGMLLSLGNTYLILSSNATAPGESRLSPDLAPRLGDLGFVAQTIPQKILEARVFTDSRSIETRVRGVGDVGAFLRYRGAYIDGRAAGNSSEACVGEVLANALSIRVGDRVALGRGDAGVEARVVCVFRSISQIDSEVIVPLDTAKILDGSDVVSIIEVRLRDNADPGDFLKAVSRISSDVRIVQTTQLGVFVREINTQVLEYLNIWSIAIYAVVAAASYVTATRLVAESGYELSMLRILGAGGREVFALIVIYILVVGLSGTILGLAMGNAAAQVFSSILRWVWPSVGIKPALEIDQVLWIAAPTMISAIAGCIYPAAKAMRTRYVEKMP